MALWITKTVPAKELQSLSLTDNPEYPHGFVDTERPTWPSAPESTEARPLDSELPADSFDLCRRRADVSSDVLGVDAGRSVAVIHNAFFIEGKVPSLNDLLDARGVKAPLIRSIIMRKSPKKAKQRGAQYDLYNDIKQDWKQRTVQAVGAPFVRVQSAYFGYVVVEDKRNRDPSNICSAAVKFIEDGLVEAGVIPNDGWDNVLGMRVHWVHRKGRPPGVYVVMSDRFLSEAELTEEYEDHFLSF